MSKSRALTTLPSLERYHLLPRVRDGTNILPALFLSLRARLIYPRRCPAADSAGSARERPMAHVLTPQSTCLFGMARCDVTPPVGIYHRMWGAATHERATGVHRPLTATALVFQAAEGPITTDTEQVVVAVDLCLLWTTEMENLLRAVSKGTGLKREQ